MARAHTPAVAAAGGSAGSAHSAGSREHRHHRRFAAARGRLSGLHRLFATVPQRLSAHPAGFGLARPASGAARTGTPVLLPQPGLPVSDFCRAFERPRRACGAPDGPVARFAMLPWLGSGRRGRRVAGQEARCPAQPGCAAQASQTTCWWSSAATPASQTASTWAARAAWAGSMASRGLWVIPPRQGMNSIAVGQIGSR